MTITVLKFNTNGTVHNKVYSVEKTGTAQELMTLKRIKL